MVIKRQSKNQNLKMISITPDNSVVFVFTWPQEIMTFVRQLRAEGLIQGHDFEFEIIHHPQRARFWFREPKRATFYRIKFS